MKIGMSTATFFGKLLTEDAIIKIQELGIDIAEVFLTTFSEYEPKFIDLLLERKGELDIYSVHSLNNHYEPELFNVVPRTRGDAEVLFNKVVVGGARLGACSYTFHGPSRFKVVDYKLDFQRIGSRAKTLAEMSIAHGVNLTYENVSWAFYSQPGYFKELHNYAPNLKGCLDIKQAMQSYRFRNDIKGRALNKDEQDALKDYTYSYIDDMADNLINVHLCDYDETGKLTAPGKGIFDFKGLINKLQDSGYDGPMMIELYSGDYSDYNELADSITYLRSFIGG
jgi:sugar phosphate isomerase/epimerase